MPEAKAAAESIPLHHLAKLKQMLHDAATHARQDVAKIPDPKARALFKLRQKYGSDCTRLDTTSKRKMSSQ